MREGSSAFLPVTVLFQPWLSHLGCICCQFEEMQVHCSDFWDVAVNHSGPEASGSSLALHTSGTRGRK